ncbi:sensor histidine kinase [Microlunatus soli]|uniref:histidine kinase n=1 Tax=Microlunatus soli TaxID=630515 RepID=A0A1H1VHR5_9ACTN|nr:sensor histidine kinase [Microlunatus soli]SDS84235.1 Signal transduction histidine kinase [Microlunatus soli]
MVAKERSALDELGKRGAAAMNALDRTYSQGSPEEQPGDGPSGRPARRGVGQVIRRTCADFGFLVGSFFISLAAFIVCIPLFAVGVGTSPIIVGLAVLTLCLSVAGGFARYHRRMLGLVGISITQTIYPPKTRGLRSRLRRLGHAQSWRELLHVLINFIIATACFPIGAVWFFAGPGGILYGLWSVWLPDQGDGSGLAYLLGFPGRIADVALNTAIGALFLITAPFVLRGLVLLQAGIARGLLDDEASALRQQVSHLATSRAAAGEAEAHTLRKLERDLHDGPQQRLVRLGMDISAAERRVGTNPDEARTMLREAFEQSQEALAEIRTLSRGIAPPILSDQGLRAAITALAARSGVPTTVDVEDVPLSDAAQNAAYFVTAEALTNMAKHSRAKNCGVELRQVGAIVVMTISDDGVGGASLAKGHGLAGLAERLSGVDGTLTVSSPPGGPTHLTATIPLQSSNS